MFSIKNARSEERYLEEGMQKRQHYWKTRISTDYTDINSFLYPYAKIKGVIYPNVRLTRKLISVHEYFE